MATQPCYFLAMPKELRLQIYEYLLRPDCIQLHSYDHELPATVYYADMNRILPRSLQPQILRTCRQVVDEAQATLYAPDHLRMKPSVRRDEFLGMGLFARPFPASRLRQDRSPQTLTMELCTSFETMATDLAHSIGLAELLGKEVRAGVQAGHQRWMVAIVGQGVLRGNHGDPGEHDQELDGQRKGSNDATSSRLWRRTYPDVA
ncbi:hypothetical protein LTR27_007042 [Elasticomyces elasticus]|nr:hypothetical protein LTR27_007042 [Elasticomyces elasticus]